ncbi:hypothetical protein [Novosphingobium sp.]|uniref:hypothetical protein n=1 Tax=Novosphingobium sp. TaxID=1874826 RepID=UPI0035B2B28F
MEIAIDLMSGLRARTAPNLRDARSGAESSVLDWHGLHGRLAAAHAARRILQADDSRFPVLAGGFANWEVLRSSHYASRAVNPIDLADGKIPAGIDGATAGELSACGRGHK